MEPSIESLTHHSVAGFRWSLTPDLQARLIDERGLRLPEWLQAGQARIVKHGPHRIVYRVELPGLCFYVKHNFVHDQRAWLRHLVRPSKARTEFDRAVAATERGIPTIAPLALAEQEKRVGSGESILITQSLEGCIPLHFFLAGVLPTFAEPRASLLRQQLAVELGRLVARIHDAGILHHDLHAANLLVRLGTDDRIELFVIDLLAVRLGPPLDWHRSRDNLVTINCWFTFHVNRADRLRFWKAYFEARKLGAWQRDAYGTKHYTRGLVEIEELSWQRNLRFWQRRDKRCLVNNRYYRKVKAPGVVGHAVTEIAANDLAELTRDPDAPVSPGPGGARPEGIALRDRDRNGLPSQRPDAPRHLQAFPCHVAQGPARVAGAADAGHTVVDPGTGLPGARFADGPAVRGAASQEDGPVPRGLSADREHFPRDRFTRIFAQPRRRPASAPPWLPASGDRAACALHHSRALHQRQLSHRDLKAANILVRRWNAPPAEPSIYSQDIQNLLYMPESSVWLIDLVGVDGFLALSQGRRVQNLSLFERSFHDNPIVTRTDRLRFLLTYLNCGAFGRCDWKSWWRQIERATRKKVRRNQRRGKLLLTKYRRPPAPREEFTRSARSTIAGRRPGDFRKITCLHRRFLL